MGKQIQRQKRKRISLAEMVFSPFIAVEMVIEKVAAEIVLRFIT